MVSVGVVVVCRNVSEWIAEALYSIDLDQVAELVIVDDFSEDNTRVVIRDFVSSSNSASKIKVLELSENVGLGPARNVGLAAIETDYVLLLDGDDYFEPNIFPALRRILKKDAYDLVFFSYARFWPDGKIENPQYMGLLRNLSRVATPQGSDFAGLPPYAWAKAYRREFLAQTGVTFFPGWYEDVPWHFSLIVQSERATAIPCVGVYYRQRTGSITRNQGLEHFDILEQYNRVVNFFRNSDNSDAELMEALYRHCRRQLFNFFYLRRLPRKSLRKFASQSHLLLSEWRNSFQVEVRPDHRELLFKLSSPVLISLFLFLVPFVKKARGYLRRLIGLGRKIGFRLS